MAGVTQQQSACERDLGVIEPVWRLVSQFLTVNSFLAAGRIERKKLGMGSKRKLVDRCLYVYSFVYVGWLRGLVAGCAS